MGTINLEASIKTEFLRELIAKAESAVVAFTDLFDFLKGMERELDVVNKPVRPSEKTPGGSPRNDGPRADVSGSFR